MPSLLVLIALLTPASFAASDPAFDQLIDSFSHNVAPDPDRADQVAAFAFYVRGYFGGNVHQLSEDRFEEITGFMRANPGVVKDQLGFVAFAAGTTPAQDDFLHQFVRGYETLRQVFARPRENVGLWRKITRDGEVLFDEGALNQLPDAEAVRTASALGPARVVEFYDAAFRRMNLGRAARTWLVANVAYFAVVDASPVVNEVRDGRGTAALGELPQLLARVDELAGPGVPDGVLRVPLLTPARLDAALAKFARQPAARAERLRPLSIAEAALRSLLAWDCASSSYFRKAFDPAFYFFTTTDQHGTSSGHYTVALGEAWRGLRKVRVAFIDKIQGVAPTRLALDLEALRQITLAAGYELALPVQIGDANALSNDEELRAAVAATPAYAEATVTYRRFVAHAPSRASGSAGFSRAYNRLAVRPVLPSTDADVTGQISLRNPEPARRLAASFDVRRAIEAAAALKDGSTEDKLRYVAVMDQARRAKLFDEPDFVARLRGWVADPRAPLELRFASATALVLTKRDLEIKDLWTHFTRKQVRALLLRWSHSPRFLTEMRLQIWFTSPQLNGDLQLTREGAFPRRLSAAARLRLAETLASPAFARELEALNERRAGCLHIDLIRVLVFAEAYARARAHGDPVAPELRTAALDELTQLIPSKVGVLPPHDDHYVPRLAELFEGPGLFIDEVYLRDFLTDPDNAPAQPSRALRLKSRASSALFATSLGGIAGGTLLLQMQEPGVALGLVASSLGLTLVQTRFFDGTLANARSQLYEINVRKERFATTTRLVESLHQAVRSRRCEGALAPEKPVEPLAPLNDGSPETQAPG